MMNKVLWSTLLATPALFSALISAPAIATETQTVSESVSESVDALLKSTEGQLSAVQPVEIQAEETQPAAEASSVAEVAPVAETPAQVAQNVPAIAEAAPIPSSAPMPSVDSLNQVIQYSNESGSIAQGSGLTIDQLTDVRPTDWAYTALQRLVEEYGCIVGYPDRTYRGNRALTRYEFAAGLNACLDRISTLIAESTADLATKEDLATLQRLQEEFAAELATLRGQVDSLEARTAELEANQFSTTTKLSGETIFAVSDIFGGGTDGVDNDLGDINETTFQYRVRLNLDTSFTGSDRLRARLQAGNFNRFVTTDPVSSTALLGNEGRLGFDTNTSNDVQIDTLAYRFPLGSRTTVQIFANGGGLDDLAPTITPFDSSGRGALSRFGQRNPIYRAPNTSAGAGVAFKFSDQLALNLGYLSGEAERSATGAGLFNGNYGAIGQLTFTPSRQLSLGLTYVNSYAGLDGTNGIGNNTGTGSGRARVEIDRPVSINSYGIQTNFRISDGFQIGGWAGYSHVRAIGVGDADVWNYALTLAFPDLGGEGNQLGIVAGIQPRLTGSDAEVGAELSGGRRSDPDVGYHIEGFYRLQLTDNISVTPGVIFLTAPNHDNNNDAAVIGTIRTTFTF